jgi:hypothetical protein
MRLPGTEMWSREAVSRRIAFERSVSDGAAFLLRETARGDRLVQFEKAVDFMASDAIFALGRAAELAFASDNFPLGLTICLEILRKRELPKTRLQFAFYLTVGALLGVFKVRLSSLGAEVKIGPEWLQFELLPNTVITWPTGNSVEAARLVSLFLPAAALSDLQVEPNIFGH